MQHKILIVDEDKKNIDLISNVLDKEQYIVVSETNPIQVRASILVQKPELIILNIHMRTFDGIDLCERIVKDPLVPKVPIIFVSNQENEGVVEACFNAGAVDFITMPFKTYEIKARVETHIKMYELASRLKGENAKLGNIVETQNKTISEMQMATIFSLAKLAQSRDDETGQHLERVQQYCCILAKHLAEKGIYKDIVTEKFLKNLVYSSPLHDIGKVAIPDAILLKPAKLTPEEYEVMKKHSELGAETLEEVYKKFPSNEFLKMGIDIAKYHHEHWDGTGYPAGLKGDEIPLSARIMAIVDVYDALSSKRVYKEAYSHKKCIEIMQEGRGTQFDARLFDCFLDVKDDFGLINQLYNRSSIVK